MSFISRGSNSALKLVYQNVHHKKLCHQESVLGERPIRIGDKVPYIWLTEKSPQARVNIYHLCKGRKALIIGTPVAFGTQCTEHLKEFMGEIGYFKSRKISKIAVIGMNDPYVMAAWGRKLKAPPMMRFLSDSKGEFTKKIQMQVFINKFGLRPKRYCLVVDNCKIVDVKEEPECVGITNTTPDMLQI